MASARETPEEQTHFGHTTVPIAAKQGLVDEVFHKVARRYDLMNDLMSLGLHRLWKDALVAALRPLRGAPLRVLDVAGGTGDVAFRILEAGGRHVSVTVLDINAAMLAVGRERAAKRLFAGQIDFVEANAESLPQNDRSFDAYTIAFGIRNVPRIERALAEAYRVLRFGGRLLVLEFAPVDLPLFARAYEAYSFALIPRLGQVVTGDGEPYRYLVESIQKFPRPDVFAAMISRAGFSRVTYRPMTGGIVNLHSAWKI